MKKNLLGHYSDAKINFLIASQISAGLIPSASASYEADFVEALAAFKNKIDVKQVVCPINLGDRFTGLHIAREENEKFRATYVDPMGTTQRIKSILPLSHSSIPYHVTKALETELGINPAEIALTTNILQPSNPNKSGLRGAINHYDGAFTAEVLIALTNGQMAVKGDRLLEKNGSEFVDVKDHNARQSHEAGIRLSERHAKILEIAENRIYGLEEEEVRDNESNKDQPTNVYRWPSFGEIAKAVAVGYLLHRSLQVGDRNVPTFFPTFAPTNFPTSTQTSFISPTSNPSATPTGQPSATPPQVHKDDFVIPAEVPTILGGLAAGVILASCRHVGAIENEVESYGITLASYGVPLEVTRGLASAATVFLTTTTGGGFGSTIGLMVSTAESEKNSKKNDDENTSSDGEAKIAVRPDANRNASIIHKATYYGALVGASAGLVFVAEEYLLKSKRKMIQLSPFIALAINDNSEPTQLSTVLESRELDRLYAALEAAALKLKKLSLGVPHRREIPILSRGEIRAKIESGHINQLKDLVMDVISQPEDLGTTLPEHVISKRIAAKLGFRSNTIVLPIDSPEYELLQTSISRISEIENTHRSRSASATGIELSNIDSPPAQSSSSNADTSAEKPSPKVSTPKGQKADQQEEELSDTVTL